MFLFTNKEKKQMKIFFSNFYRVRFSSKTWSGRKFGVLGPENSDSSSKTTLEVGGVSQFVKPPTGKSFRFVRACEREISDSIVQLGLL